MDNSLPQLVSTLEATYPRLRAWLGDERFERAAIRHLEHNPSYAWTHDACVDDCERSASGLKMLGSCVTRGPDVPLSSTAGRLRIVGRD